MLSWMQLLIAVVTWSNSPLSCVLSWLVTISNPGKVRKRNINALIVGT